MIRNMEELKKLSVDEKAKLFDETIEHLYKSPIGWVHDAMIIDRGSNEKDCVDWFKQFHVLLSLDNVDNIIVLIQSETGTFSGFLANPFGDDPYQVPVDIGTFSFERDDVERFVDLMINSDVGYRHNSTNIAKIANIGSFDDIKGCIERANDITGVSASARAIYVYQNNRWDEGFLIDEDEIKLTSLTGYYGTPSSKEMLASSPCIKDFSALIAGPTSVLESAISKAVGTEIDGSVDYEEHQAVKELCDWWNTTIDDDKLKCAKNFCLYYWDVASATFKSCDYEEPACSLEGMQEHKNVASFDYHGTTVVAAFIKGDKEARYRNHFATNYKVDGKIWTESGCGLSDINTSCISISCLQYLPKSLLKSHRDN